MAGKPLPNSIDSANPAIRAAFERCRQIESFLMAEAAIDAKKVEEELMDLRVASYFLLYAPSDEGKQWAASSIMSAVEDDKQVAAFGQFIRKYYIRSFKQAKGRTPFISRHPSPSFDEAQREIVANLDQAPQNHTDAKMKALVRDNHRCMLSGAYDAQSYLGMKMHISGARVEETHCAHIFDESTNDFTTAKVVIAKKEYAANVWTIMRYMGYPDVLTELKGSSIHRLGNVLTLTATLHRVFEKLQFCLDATGNPNEYNVMAAPGVMSEFETVGLASPAKVTLSNACGLEPPSPTYLAIHAACYRIAHLSGAADWYARIDAGGDAGCNATIADESMFAIVLMDRLERLPEVVYAS
ncbi:hypothetical protein CYLTODRAFT_492903 [Cylindrobasidium torrendii FP15055 ss-10]|uniref:HNH nuclease domain-containing protein n=1 Tax=Cylindrobasidium torrendii FP15055 ss-10 TaxID=1314674 RepID=A0A0D7B2I3_9AGAR|nr:hypothetical protein CYLTODRAFT_492903 [Cylindrobasidium torrendii FP15055 ss-10]